MIASVDPYLHRIRTDEYDCLAFATEVWRDLTGEDLGPRFASAFGEGGDPFSVRHAFRVLTRPRSPCLVLFGRPRGEPHIGVFFAGRVLHLDDRAASFQPLWLAARTAIKVTFFDTQVE